ncbi:MAG: MBL fold metallo-hydrolase [Planctomycetes bacterium]|nr:MBL fold metallo-hydrolase [Planctomycetota bacterium]
MTATVTAPFIRQVTRQGEGCLGYVIADPETRRAAIVDPRHDQVDEYLALLQRENLTLELVLDTHTHADHLSGAAELKRRTGARYGMMQGTLVQAADLPLNDGQVIQLGELPVEIIASPGHTPDSLTVHVPGNLFTGDTMLIGGSGRTDFMGGDAGSLYDSFRKFARLDDATVVWPGHDYQGRSHSTLGRERAHNVVFTAGGREQVIEKLSVRGPLPQGMAEILTFNRRGSAPGESIEPAELHGLMRENPHAAQIVDVRSPLEVSGESIEGSWNIPLEELEDRAAELAKAQGVVVLNCQSGNRALMAAQILQRRKFSNYRILQGGMKGWNKAGLPVKRGRKVVSVMRQVQIAAGLLVLTGMALGTFVNPWFFALSAFVGAGLTFAGASGFCGMALLLGRLPWNRVAPTTGGGTSGGCQAGGGTAGSCSVGGGCSG